MPFDDIEHNHGGGGGDHSHEGLKEFIDEYALEAFARLCIAHNKCPACSLDEFVTQSLLIRAKSAKESKGTKYAVSYIKGVLNDALKAFAIDVLRSAIKSEKDKQ